MEGTLLPKEIKEEILTLYKGHAAKMEQQYGCCLDEYLDTAAICYKAAFGSEVTGLTAEQMYKKLADGRDCGMLEIRDRKSKDVFGYWLKTESGCGGHPFEIKFSWHGHGIHLFPPQQERHYFLLRVTDYMYAGVFIEIVKALVQNNVAFKAHELDDVLEYLCGESYFTVNAHSEHNIDYDNSYRKILRNIEWDQPGMLKWK